MVTRLTSRDFNRNPSAAKRAAAKEPVVIAERGKPRFVLMSYRAYSERRPAVFDESESILAKLADVQASDIDFEPPRLAGPIARGVDFD